MSAFILNPDRTDKKKLDSWYILVDKNNDILHTLIFRDMGQRCLWNNCSTYITVAIFQALATWDPWKKHSISSKKAQLEPLQFLRLHFLYSKNG